LVSGLPPKMPSLYFSVLSLPLNDSYLFSKSIWSSTILRDLAAIARSSASSASAMVFRLNFDCVFVGEAPSPIPEFRVRDALAASPR
jgi:hypothetical protein